MPATGTVLLALDNESRVKLSTVDVELVDEFCVVTLTYGIQSCTDAAGVVGEVGVVGVVGVVLPLGVVPPLGGMTFTGGLLPPPPRHTRPMTVSGGCWL